MLQRSFKSLFYFIFILFSFTGISQTFNDIPGISGEIYFVEYTEEHNIMFIGGEELYVSDDDGLSWYEVDNSIGSGLEGVEFYGGAAMSPNDFVILCHDGGYDKVFISNDSGQTWTETFSNSHTDFEMGKDIIDANSGTVIISGEYGVYRSTDFAQTWNQVVIGNYTDPSDILLFNNQSGLWYAGASGNGLTVSSDDGANWSTLGLGIDGDQLRGVFQSGTNTIICIENGSSFDYFTVDNSGTISETFSIVKNELAFGYKDLSRFGLTPAGDLLTENGPSMYKLDTASNELYYFLYPGVQNSFTEGGLDLGSDIGLAFHSDYLSSQPYLIDYANVADFYVSGNFYFVNGNTVCAGDDIIADAYADHADSVRWYVDNQYYATSGSISYPTVPNQYVTYSFMTEVFYNGEMSTQTRNITLDPPAVPIGFTYTVDTTPCYGNPLPIAVSSGSGNQGQTLIQVDYNGQTVYGPITLSTTSMNLWIPNVVEEDTFKIITSTTDPCSSNADTIVQGMTVGPNLLDFDYIAEDSVMCLDDSMKYQLFDTDPNWNYNLSSEYTFPNSYNSQPTSYSGLFNDSITYYSESMYIQNENVAQEGLDPIYYYLNIEVNAPNGCSQSSTVDTVRVYRPSSYFRIHQKSYEPDSALEISNYIPVNNRLWSSTSILQSDISNNTDTVPLISSSLPGFHDVTLRNEPIPGCIDERTEYVQYAVPSSSHENCSSQNAPKDKLVMRTKFDHEGNLYSIGCYRNGPSYMRAATYSLERFDGTDSVLWSIDGDFTGIKTYGAIIESIDFDKNNDVICVGWLSYDSEDYDDGIMTSFGGQSSLGLKFFVFKLDGDDGSLIWNKEIIPMLPGTVSTRLRPTDIVISDGNIYVSMYGSGSLHFLVLDSLGNFVQYDELQMPWSQAQYFIGGQEHIPTSTFSWTRARYNSPRIKALSNGDIIAMGRFRSTGIPGFPEFDLGNGAEFGLFAFKYNKIDGIHDYETISKIGFQHSDNYYGGGYGIGKPVYFDVDKNDNIYVGSQIEGIYLEEHETLSVLDSVLPKTPHTYVFKMNKDFDLDWLTLGTHGEIQGLSFNRKSQEVLLSGAINESIGFSSDTVDIYSGKDLTVIHDTSSLSGVFLNYHTKQDVFLSSFDTIGNPKFVEIYDFLEFTTQYTEHIVKSNLASSPCGDYALHIAAQPSNWLIDQDTVAIDSIKIITGSTAQNCSFDCRYFVPDDTVRICSNSELTVYPKEYFNIDSILYSISSNGNAVVTGQYVTMNNGSLNIPTPLSLSNDSTLTISYDNSLTTDSTFVYFISPPTFNYEDTICEGEVQTIDFLTGAFDYYLDDTLNISGNSYSVPQNHQSIGNNSFPITSIHINNIECFDTMNYYLNYAPTNYNLSYDELVCDGDYITFSADSPYNYQYDWDINGVSGQSTVAEPWTYTIGQNQTYVTITHHYNGCQIIDTINFVVEDCANLDIHDLEDIQVLPNPNTGDFRVVLKDGSSINELFLTDLTGKVILNKIVKGKSEVIFNTKLSAGTYYLKYNKEKESYALKIIIVN